MTSSEHHESIFFYIENSVKIKKELLKYETEYHPEKVRSIIASYKLTLSKILSHCEGYLREEKDDWEELEKIQDIYEKYKNFLATL